MKYLIITATLLGISFGIRAQKMSYFEKLLQLERSRIFPFCGKLNLSQNFPNPVSRNEKSLINYRAIDVVSAEIVVYDNTGEIVFLKRVEPGVGEVEIHGIQLKPGNYFYALVADGRRIFRKKLTILDSSYRPEVVSQISFGCPRDHGK